MVVQTKVSALLLVTILTVLPQGAFCQKLKGAVAARAALSSSLERSVVNVVKRPDIRLSVARLDHAVLMDAPPQKRPHSTAFLFRTTYKGTPEVWAATAGHVAQKGEELYLTFYNQKKEIVVKGTLVQEGPALLSDAALIRLDTPLPPELQPFTLAEHIQPQESLTTWGYASNKLYQINDLTFEKDNTRFIRTDFPENQKKRSGLCGGPLVNPQGEVLGIHCGTSLDDKSYAANIGIIPYLLQAYYEGTAEIPLVARDIVFGAVQLNEKIVQILCEDEYGQIINREDVYRQLPQSLIMSLYQDPEVRYMHFLLCSEKQGRVAYRALVYDKKTGQHWFKDM